uniref:Uncharacterized protein n=1 Tax=Anopheles coluzzii TaxID=1518534 RepID=A0A8W7Q2R4_ANOCL
MKDAKCYSTSTVGSLWSMEKWQDDDAAAAPTLFVRLPSAQSLSRGPDVARLLLPPQPSRRSVSRMRCRSRYTISTSVVTLAADATMMAPKMARSFDCRCWQPSRSGVRSRSSSPCSRSGPLHTSWAGSSCPSEAGRWRWSRLRNQSTLQSQTSGFSVRSNSTRCFQGSSSSWKVAILLSRSDTLRMWGSPAKAPSSSSSSSLLEAIVIDSRFGLAENAPDCTWRRLSAPEMSIDFRLASPKNAPSGMVSKSFCPMVSSSSRFNPLSCTVGTFSRWLSERSSERMFSSPRNVSLVMFTSIEPCMSRRRSCASPSNAPGSTRNSEFVPRYSSASPLSGVSESVGIVLIELSSSFGSALNSSLPISSIKLPLRFSTRSSSSPPNNCIDESIDLMRLNLITSRPIEGFSAIGSTSSSPSPHVTCSFSSSQTHRFGQYETAPTAVASTKSPTTA